MSKITLKEKVQMYERLLHKLSLNYSTGNSPAIKDLLNNIDNWSYAHRSGNGELTEKEQQQRIDSAFKKLTDTK